MNQILLTDYDDNKKKNNKSNKTNNKNNSNDIKKIITFFAVTILVFGIAIGGVYGYKAYKNSKDEEKTIRAPIITLENTEEEVTIIVEADAGISRIIYQWNDEDEEVKEIEGGRTSQKEQIDMPSGRENTLKVKVVDQLGQEKETTQNFQNYNYAEENSDKIEIEATGESTGEITVKVVSQLPIKNISYRIGDAEETIIEPQDEQTTTMEEKINVKDKLQRGVNIVTIKVTDVQENSKELERKLEGQLAPEINVYIDGERIYVKVTHDMGLKEIQFNINGKAYAYDESKEIYDSEKQEVEFYFSLQAGENIAIIKATSNEGTTKEYSGGYNHSVQ